MREDVTTLPAPLLTDFEFELLKVEKVGFSLTSGFGFAPPPEELGVLFWCCELTEECRLRQLPPEEDVTRRGEPDLRMATWWWV